MNKQILDRRVIAGILIVLSILTLFLDFAGLSAAARSELGLVPGWNEASNLMDSMFGLSAYALGDTSSEVYKLFNKLAKMFRSGGLSVMEVRSLLSICNRLAKMEGSGEPTLTFVSILFTVFILVTLGSGAYALYGVYKHKRARGYWFAAMLLVLLIAGGLLVAIINSESGATFASLTAWPFLGLSFAISSIVLCYQGEGAPAQSRQAFNAETGAAIAGKLVNAVQVGKKMSKKIGREVGKKASQAAASAAAGAASIINAGNWTCPQCGRAVEGSARFCSACGAARPEKIYCPKCGSEAKEGASFCSRCGFSLQNLSVDVQQSQAFNSQAQAQPFQGQSFQAQRFHTPAQSVQPQVMAQNGSGAEGYSESAGFNSSSTLRIVANASVAPLPLDIEVAAGNTGFSQIFRLDLDSSIVIGRNPSCDLQIQDETVSGTHLRIDREGDAVYVTDMNSSNGTTLNGVPLRERAELSGDDRLTLGLTSLAIRWSPELASA